VRYPPWDIRTEFYVLRPVALSQGRLLVDENKEMESHPHRKTVFKDADAAEKQSLTKNEGHHGNIHRIADVSI